MRIPATVVLTVASLTLVGCGHVRATGSQPSPVAVTAPPPLSSVAVTSTSDAAAGTSDTVAAAAPGSPEADGRFSLVVFDRTTGQVVMSENPTDHFPAESVVKLLIAVTALQNGSDAGLVATMLSVSDDDIANTLWEQYGNIAIIERMAKVMDLPDIVVPDDPGWWGNTQITADDVVEIYRYILDRAPAPLRDTIMKALASTTRTAADDFYQYYGIVDATEGHDWAVKQGWACCKPDRVLHSTGVIGDDHRYIIAALSAHDGPSTTWDQVGGELTDTIRQAEAKLHR
ncbi:serine hydrolase [Kutzneria sp. NPDC051319]|uniref:serine hydrolase n=1 Tax=Kutzneria sp. NPDC051319 TaxID=3155047 RepID=UPI0034451A03